LEAWGAPLHRSDFPTPKGCPDCRRLIAGVRRYGRVVLHSQLGVTQRKHAEAVRCVRPGCCCCCCCCCVSQHTACYNFGAHHACCIPGGQGLSQCAVLQADLLGLSKAVHLCGTLVSMWVD
jgi:hypothetical protein